MELLVALLVVLILVFIGTRRNKIDETTTNNIEKFLEEINEARKDYIVHEFIINIKTNYARTYKVAKSKKQLGGYEDLVNQFISIYEELDNNVTHWNEEYIEEELKVNKTLFNK